jgi:2,3-bisphosphoglycerate-independent phosphoglycerate mutase
VERIVKAVQAKGGVLLITADHGNAETMRDDTGKVHTAHTLNPVQLILVDESRRQATLREGILGDIAPTVLEIMGIRKPAEMTGRSLVVQV